MKYTEVEVILEERVPFSEILIASSSSFLMFLSNFYTQNE